MSEIEENENEDEFENDDEFEDDDELENVDELEDDELSSEEVDIPSENEVIVELHDGQGEQFYSFLLFFCNKIFSSRSGGITS